MDVDFERSLGMLPLPVLALQMRDDWIAPSRSLARLLDKMPMAAKRSAVIAPEQLAGQPADHFSWMKAPAGPVRQWMQWMTAQGPT
jgi:predicted alpha/beta hydrolase